MNNHVPLALCLIFLARSQKKRLHVVKLVPFFFSLEFMNFALSWSHVLTSSLSCLSPVKGNINSVSIFCFFSPFCLHHVEIYHSIIDPACQFFFSSASNDRLPTSHLIVLWFIRQKRVKSLTGAVGKECR